jgi:hypothetical protein
LSLKFAAAGARDCIFDAITALLMSRPSRSLMGGSFPATAEAAPFKTTRELSAIERCVNFA